jgi:hypothetical protein
MFVMKLGFLLGAGISRACSGPATGELTNIVLRGENVSRHSSGTYFLSDRIHPGLGDREGIERIRTFLAFLNSHANRFFAQKEKDRVADYEDLYYLVSQLADASDEYENPAVSGLLEAARNSFVMPEFQTHSAFRSDKLFEEARCYIKGIVAHSLGALWPNDNHLDQLAEAASDGFISQLEIFTLNQDRLIEQSLEHRNIAFSTGFVPLSADLLCWDRQKFAKAPGKVRLNKLHGSVDWCPVRLSTTGPSRVCIATNGDVEHAQGPTGETATLLPDSPEMLTGTFNKMLEYTMGIYADLFCAFRSTLRGLDRLLISGYSFRDKGINASIAEWMRENNSRRMLVIAPDASHYACTARGAIRRLLQSRGAQIKLLDRRWEVIRWCQIRGWASAPDTYRFELEA